MFEEANLRKIFSASAFPRYKKSKNSRGHLHPGSVPSHFSSEGRSYARLRCTALMKSGSTASVRRSMTRCPIGVSVERTTIASPAFS